MRTAGRDAVEAGESVGRREARLRGAAGAPDGTQSSVIALQASAGNKAVSTLLRRYASESDSQVRQSASAAATTGPTDRQATGTDVIVPAANMLRVAPDDQAPGRTQPIVPTGHRLVALQRAAGNRAVTTMLARQSADSPPVSVMPTEPAMLTNQQLLDEMQALERGGSSPGGGDAEDRYRLLIDERDRRVRSGHVWLTDAGAVDLLQAVGQDAGARIEVSERDPHQEIGSSVQPTFSRRQLDSVLQRNGVPVVDISTSDPSSTIQAAGAVPGPSLSPQVLGRFYPFLRPMTAAERTTVSGRGAVHYTPETNLPDILQPDGAVGLRPSTGYRNLTDPGSRPSSYFFSGEPSPAQYGSNIAGGPAKSAQAVIFVQGAELPSGTLFRPLDNVLSIPGGYRGPAQLIRPGQQIPAGNGIPLPAQAGPMSMAQQLSAQGSFSGHPLAAGAGAGVIAVVLETGVVLVATGELPTGERLARAGTTGTAGGVVGATVEQVAARRLAGTALGQNAGRIFLVLGRGGAGAIGGFVAAPVVELGRMAIDDEHHTGVDYAARGTRAAVAGGLSGAMAAGAAAAVAGSVAPGVGTAIGFVVGVGGYLLLDWLMGDAVESSVRAVAR